MRARKEFTVRTTGKVMEPALFNQIAIVNRGGYVVKISDIGYAEDSYEEPRTAARLDGRRGCHAGRSKQSGENTVRRRRSQAAFERDRGDIAERCSAPISSRIIRVY